MHIAEAGPRTVATEAEKEPIASPLLDFGTAVAGFATEATVAAASKGLAWDAPDVTVPSPSPPPPGKRRLGRIRRGFRMLKDRFRRDKA